MKRPLTVIGFSILGAAAVVFYLKETVWLLVLAALLMVLGACLRRFRQLFITIGIVTILSVFYFQWYTECIWNTPLKYNGVCTITGLVTEQQYQNELYRIQIRVTAVNGERVHPFGMALWDEEERQTGVYWEETCIVSMDAVNADDGDNAYFMGQGIRRTATVLYCRSVNEYAVPILRSLSLVSQKLSFALSRNLVGQVREMATAMVLGDRSNMREDTADLFEKSGMSHVLAVSGLHVSLVGIALFWLLRKWKMPPGIAAVFAILLVWMYVGLVGFRPSALRAAIMLTIYLLGPVLYRKSDALNSLGAGCGILLIISPYLVMNAGFLLSVLSVAGIVTVGATLGRWMSERRVLRRFSPVSAVIGAYAYTLPLLTSLFGGVYPAAIFSNLVLLPVIGVFLVLSFLLAIIGTVGNFDAIARVVGYVVQIIGGGIIVFMEWIVSVFPFFLALSVFCACILSVGVLFIWFIRRKNWRKPLSFLVAAFLSATVILCCFGGNDTQVWVIGNDASIGVCILGKQGAELVVENMNMSFRKDLETFLHSRNIKTIGHILVVKQMNESGILQLAQLKKTVGVQRITAGEWLEKDGRLGHIETVEKNTVPFMSYGWKGEITPGGVAFKNDKIGLFIHKNSGRIQIENGIMINNEMYGEISFGREGTGLCFSMGDSSTVRIDWKDQMIKGVWSKIE